MPKKPSLSRRSCLKGLGAIGAPSFIGIPYIHKSRAQNANPSGENDAGSVRTELSERILKTPFIDTHEHLIEEKGRFSGTTHPRVRSDDWTMLFSHYLDSDMITAGMGEEDHARVHTLQIFCYEGLSVSTIHSILSKYSSCTFMQYFLKL